MARNLNMTPVYNGLAPAENPKVINWEINWSAQAIQQFDLFHENASGVFQFAQTAWIDNSRNAAPVVLIVGVSGQRITVAAGTQEIVPIFSPDQTQLTALSTVGNAITLVQLLNVPLPAASWSSIAPGAQAALSQGTDRSGTLAAGGTAQVLAAANPNRMSLTGQNISDANLGISENDVNPVIGSPGTYTILPGQTFAIATNRSVRIIGPTTGKAWTATET